MNQNLVSIFSRFNAKFNEPIAPYTTWKIGGPADILAQSTSSYELQSLLETAIAHNIPYTILGGGSNVLVSDDGLKGLVIINKSRNILIEDKLILTNTDNIAEDAQNYNVYITPRHGEADEDFYSFKDLDYTEDGPKIRVKFDSGVDLTYAIAWTLKNGLTGLQWFAGIPGTIGGALYNNIHGGTKHFSDNFYTAKIMEISGNKYQIKEVGFDYFDFGYDQSILRNTKNIIVLEVNLNLFKGDTEKAKLVANEWTKRKRRQPRITAGCTFKNIPLDKQKELGFPTPSVGYIVDKVFGWRGKSVGGAIISQNHANFIENTGGAKAEDVLSLINQVKNEAKKRFDLDLETEINLLGINS